MRRCWKPATAVLRAGYACVGSRRTAPPTSARHAAAGAASAVAAVLEEHRRPWLPPLGGGGWRRNTRRRPSTSRLRLAAVPKLVAENRAILKLPEDKRVAAANRSRVAHPHVEREQLYAEVDGEDSDDKPWICSTANNHEAIGSDTG